MVLAVASRTSLASTGACDATSSAPQACVNSIQAVSGIVSDVFRDVCGHTAAQLPLYGTLFNAWPGCPAADFAGCAGRSLSPYDCPGEYSCDAGVADTLANAGAYVSALDHLWWMPCRLSNHALVNGCPQFAPASCVVSGTAGNYLPWEGLVFDLGAGANQVAVFGANDFALQPCESIEYTVYLTDDPSSRDLITDPFADGVDATRWNRAAMRRLFTQGTTIIRPPDPAGHGSCGDNSQYSVEMDSMVPVFALPPGSNLRYAAIIAGNDGLDFPSCGYDSGDAEVDAVAGLSEAGVGICPDGSSTVEGAGGLTWAADSRTLSWIPQNGASRFDVFRGSITSPWFYNESCLQSAVTATSINDSTAPAAGHGFFYLVAGRGACGDGLLGRKSDGSAIPAACSCP